MWILQKKERENFALQKFDYPIKNTETFFSKYTDKMLKEDKNDRGNIIVFDLCLWILTKINSIVTEIIVLLVLKYMLVSFISKMTINIEWIEIY